MMTLKYILDSSATLTWAMTRQVHKAGLIGVSSPIFTAVKANDLKRSEF
jgi:uncharacterized membrane protein